MHDVLRTDEVYSAVLILRSLRVREALSCHLLLQGVVWITRGDLHSFTLLRFIATISPPRLSVPLPLFALFYSSEINKQQQINHSYN